jgi:hypothetical protein
VSNAASSYLLASFIAVRIVFLSLVKPVAIDYTYVKYIGITANVGLFKALLSNRQCHFYGSKGSVLEAFYTSISTVLPVSPVLCDYRALCCHDISLLRGWLVAGLPLTCIKGGALGYKSMGRSHHDSITIINTINYLHVQVLYL